MKRRELFSLASAAFLAAQTPRRRPNIIWFMADDLGLGDVGCYGQKIIQTPNIDRLAREGIRFTEAYAGCTVCAPSRSALMTGLHTGHTPIRSNPGGCPLLPGETTVADLLKQAGYRTGLFGKWGLGDIQSEGVPWKHGFDEFFGFLHQAHAHFQYPSFLYSNDKEYPLAGNANNGRQTFANDVMNEKSLDFIRRHKDQAFFLYASPTIPHFEPHVPEDSLAAYRGKVPNGNYKGGPRLKAQPELGPAYAGMVSRLDGYLGRILDLLKELKLENDTLVFFTSDNGGMMGNFEQDHFRNTGIYRGQKGNFYEGGIRVPMVARWPNKIKPGSTSAHAWAFWDFLPTACELAGVKPPSGLDGISVVPALLGKKQKAHDYLYWELPEYDNKALKFQYDKPVFQALRKGNWKAIRPRGGQPVELYDLAKDPIEKNNLAAANPKLTAELDALLKSAHRDPRPQTEHAHPWWEAKS